MDLPEAVPQASLTRLIDFVNKADPQSSILFVFYDQDYNICIENTLTSAPMSLKL